MRMNIGHRRRLGTFEQNDGPMGTSRQSCRLWKEPSIRERGREIRVRLSFHDDAFVNGVIANGEAHHLHVEVIARSRKVEQCGVMLRKVGAKLPPSRARIRRGRNRLSKLRRQDSFSGRSRASICGGENQRSTVGATINQSHNTASALARFRTTYDPTTDHQQVSVSRTVEFSTRVYGGLRTHPRDRTPLRPSPQVFPSRYDNSPSTPSS